MICSYVRPKYLYILLLLLFSGRFYNNIGKNILGVEMKFVNKLWLSVYGFLSLLILSAKFGEIVTKI